MLRIKLAANNDDGSILVLTGRLADEFVSEAERVCLSAESPFLIDATDSKRRTPTGSRCSRRFSQEEGGLKAYRGISRCTSRRFERGVGTEVRKVESYPGPPVEGSGAADIPHTRLYRGALRRGENQAAPSPGGPQEGAEAARPDGQLTMPSHEEAIFLGVP